MRGDHSKLHCFFLGGFVDAIKVTSVFVLFNQQQSNCSSTRIPLFLRWQHDRSDPNVVLSCPFGLQVFGDMDRGKKIEGLAQALYEGFIKDDGGDYLAVTGEICGSSSLRTHKTRKAFALVRASAEGSGEKRFWTKAAIRDSIKTMMRDYNLSIPKTSGFSWSQWLKEQSDRIHQLSQKARKAAWKMDTMQTLPYDPMEDRSKKHKETHGTNLLKNI